MRVHSIQIPLVNASNPAAVAGTKEHVRGDRMETACSKLTSVAIGPANSSANTIASWIEEPARIAVNRNVCVAGHLVFQQASRIEGHFLGEVSSSELVVISEDGSVGGRVRSPRVLVL